MAPRATRPARASHSNHVACAIRSPVERAGVSGARARRLGCRGVEIAALLPAGGGADCRPAHDRVTRLLETKQAEIAERIASLQEFAAQLDGVRAELDAAPPPVACNTDLSCCLPAGADFVPLELVGGPSGRRDGS